MSVVNKLLRLVAKAPMPASTKTRLKELYRELRLRISHSTTPPSAKTDDGSGVQHNRTSINDIFVSADFQAVKDPQILDRSTVIKIYPCFDSYMKDGEVRKILRQTRNDYEQSLLLPDRQPFRYSAACSVCKSQREFEVDYLYAYEQNDQGRLIPNWRESLVCEKCRMNNRIRAVVDLLDHQIMINSREVIYATEQLTVFYQWLVNNYANVIGSEFLGDDKTPGNDYKSIRHEDITRLSFSDSTVDVILSFEVLEHVPDTDSSIREFLRVLCKGGFALISVPFVSNNYETIVRAEVAQDGTINHILEPEYHGNPTNPDEGSLCFYHFGWDLIDKFKSAGAADAAVISYYSIENANLGNEQLFFLILK